MIPEGWNSIRLGDCLSIEHGRNQAQVVDPNGRFPILGSGGEIGRTNAVLHEGPSVLIGRKGTIDRPQYMDSPFWTVDTLFYSRIRDGYLPKFVYYKFLMVNWRSFNEASGVPSLNASTIEGVEITVPPLAEQQAIAEALSDADALVESLDALIAKKRDMKQAAMQQLLTGRTRLPGFSEEWREIRLGDHGTFSKGQGIKKDEVVASGLPCIRYGQIYTDHSDWIRSFTAFISPVTAQASRRLVPGELLFTGSGETAAEIGKCVAFLGDGEAYAGGDIVILTPRSLDSKFMGYALNSPVAVQQKMRLAQGDAVVHISSSSLATLSLAVPPLGEQQAIAEALSDMDAEIEALVAQRGKMRLVKQGMMQELLSGRVRLV